MGWNNKRTRKKWQGFLVKIQYCSKSGKPCFDKITATTAINARWHQDHERLRMYPCPDCQREGKRGVWHLTSHFNTDDHDDMQPRLPRPRTSNEDADE